MTDSDKETQNKMIQRQYEIRFNTPAFLGNAEQNGQWRTPPFKHLLREWWRVAWAEAHGPADVSEMRRKEAQLFGSAADGSGNRSLVRIRLGHWDMGKEKNWGDDLPVIHSEVQRNQGKVGSQLYLGYGPLKYARGTKLKYNAAIQAGELADLRLAFPEGDSHLLERTLELMSAFGTVGGRSRNGWGSFTLLGAEGQPVTVKRLPLRSWKKCLDLEWAHAIGEDGRGALIWRTKAFSDWCNLMQELARIKIAIRIRFDFRLLTDNGDQQLYRRNKKTKKKEKAGIEHGSPQDRHWLSYPVTNHSVKPWDDMVKKKEVKKKGLGNRLPNTLRFKVRKDENGKYYGVIFHMPCRPPAEFNPDMETLKIAWSYVHGFLDGYGGWQRGW